MKTSKYALAESLKKMLEAKTLDHITVTDIVQDCQMTRQAFYYHFNDIYDLLEWIYMQEAELLEQHQDIHTWQDGYRQVLDWSEENKNLVINTCRSVSREYLETFTYRVLYPMLYNVAEQQSKDRNIKKEYIEFIARFYTLSLIAINLDWVRKGMEEPKEHLIRNVETIMKDNYDHAFDKFEELSSHIT